MEFENFYIRVVYGRWRAAKGYIRCERIDCSGKRIVGRNVFVRIKVVMLYWVFFKGCSEMQLLLKEGLRVMFALLYNASLLGTLLRSSIYI